MVMESERGQRESCGIYVRPQRNAVDDSVAGVPPAFWARSIEQHLRSEAQPFLEFATPNQSLPLCAFHSDERHRRRHHPTRSVRNPWPTVLPGIEPNLPVCEAKFQADKPRSL